MPKKTPNPYEALGVDKDADPATIKRAYRRKAQKKHPDAGGNAEEFAPVAEAYRILSTPLLKAAYDQTGEVDEKPMDVKVRENLIAAFRGALALGDDKSILQAVREQLKAAIANSEQQRAVLKYQLDNDERILQKKRGKVTKNGPMNCFLLVIDHELRNIAQQRQQIPLLVAQEELFHACLNALMEYSEDFVEPPKRIPQRTATGAALYQEQFARMVFDNLGRPIERR